MNHGLAIVVVLAAAAAARADDFFEKEIRPLLVEKCQRCHGPKKQESGLRVDSRAALLKGGETGPAVVPGKVDAGALLDAVHGKGDLRMPPGEKLRADQIAALTRWIADGAKWPEVKTADQKAGNQGPHWAFQPVRDFKVPAVRAADWPINDLDRFILAKLEAQGLKPIGQADAQTLLRRATFDLTGLPPTLAEIDAFVNDRSPDAWRKVVDRLLASPAYGERWGRHWLDVARYADTAGDGADYPVTEARLYRDWVIAAFNADKPYDQFLREQLAGDILARTSPADQYAPLVTATGFLAIGKRYGYSPAPDFHYLDFADAIDSVGRSVLGLSLGCARCHDHKYDPITAADYYGLYGILQSTKWSFPGGEEHPKPANFAPLVPPDVAAQRERTKAEDLARLDAHIRQLKAEQNTLEGKNHGGGVDLGFEGQTLGKAPSGAWLSIGPNAVNAAAQSPFVHVHPKGTRGVRLGPKSTNHQSASSVFRG